MEVYTTSPTLYKCNMDKTNVAYNIFNELRLEGQLCDVVIKVDGVEFNAHKNILCGCSSYFRALFTSVWNSEKSVYTIPGTTPEMMRMIIDFAYASRTLPVTEDNVEQLLEAADQFCITGIVQACCHFLELQLCPENCLGICTFADFYSCAGLRRKAFLFALHHFRDVVEVSEEFPELPLARLCGLLERDDLNAAPEDVVYRGVLRWVGHDVSTRKHSLPVLLLKVRLALMTPDYFIDHILNNPLLTCSNDCKHIVLKALKAFNELNTYGPSDLHFRKPMCRPRLPYNILLAIGGWTNGGPTDVVEAYDTRANRWVKVAQSETPRAYHGTEYLNGFVYCVGGFDGTSYFNDVRKFNPVTRTWCQVAPMHSRRCYVSTAVLGGLIYAMGGFDGYLRVNTAECYEPAANQWTLIAPMHENRSDANATTLNGKVYICGGFNGEEYLFNAESYCPRSDQWTLIEPMMSRRSGVGVIAYHHELYAVGGFDGTHRLKTAEVYSPISKSWRAVRAMFKPRSNFGIEVVDDGLYAVGGFDGANTSSKVEHYDYRTGEWRDVDDMATVRSGLGCCVAPGLPNVSEYVVPRDARALARFPSKRMTGREERPS